MKFSPLEEVDRKKNIEVYERCVKKQQMGAETTLDDSMAEDANNLLLNESIDNSMNTSLMGKLGGILKKKINKSKVLNSHQIQ